MSEHPHADLTRCTAILLVGAGMLELWSAPGDTALHAVWASALGVGMVAAGGLLLVRPRVWVARAGSAAGALAVAAWAAGQLGIRGESDALTLDLTLAAAVSAAAAIASLACARTLGGSGSTVSPRPARLAVLAALVVGVTWGAAAVSTSDDGSAGRASAQDPVVSGDTTTTTHEHGQEHPVQENPDIDAEHAAPEVPLDAATRTQLADQVVIARQTALRFPTVAAADAAGLLRSGAFSPGAGAHYFLREESGGVQPDGQVDPSRPAAWLFDGTSPTSRVVGLMYTSSVVDSTVQSYAGSGEAPQGFAGPNDHWHRHEDVCMTSAPDAMEILLAPDTGTTKAECEGLGGEYVERSFWMLHVWVVPGWESPTGVFSHTNPVIISAPGSVTDWRGYCEELERRWLRADRHRREVSTMRRCP